MAWRKGHGISVTATTNNTVFIRRNGIPWNNGQLIGAFFVKIKNVSANPGDVFQIFEYGPISLSVTIGSEKHEIKLSWFGSVPADIGGVYVPDDTWQFIEFGGSGFMLQAPVCPVWLIVNRSQFSYQTDRDIIGPGSTDKPTVFAHSGIEIAFAWFGLTQQMGYDELWDGEVNLKGLNTLVQQSAPFQTALELLLDSGVFDYSSWDYLVLFDHLDYDRYPDLGRSGGYWNIVGDVTQSWGEAALAWIPCASEDGESETKPGESYYPFIRRWIGLKKNINLLLDFKLKLTEATTDTWTAPPFMILFRHDPQHCESAGCVNGLGLFAQPANGGQTLSLSYPITNSNVTGYKSWFKLSVPGATFISDQVVPGMKVTFDNYTDITAWVLDVLDEETLVISAAPSYGEGEIDTVHIDGAKQCINLAVVEVTEEGHRYIGPWVQDKTFVAGDFAQQLDEWLASERGHALGFGSYQFWPGVDYVIHISVNEYNAFEVRIWPKDVPINSADDIEDLPVLFTSVPYVVPVVDGDWLQIYVHNLQPGFMYVFGPRFYVWPNADVKLWFGSTLESSIYSDWIGDNVNLYARAWVEDEDGNYFIPEAWSAINSDYKWTLMAPTQPIDDLNLATINTPIWGTDDEASYSPPIYAAIASSVLHSGPGLIFATSIPSLNVDEFKLVKYSDETHNFGVADVYVYTALVRTEEEVSLDEHHKLYLSNKPIARVISVQDATAPEADVNWTFVVEDSDLRFSSQEKTHVYVTNYPPGSRFRVVYEYFDAITDIQSDLDSWEGNLPVGHVLIYHFRPVFCKVDVRYSSPIDPTTIASGLKNYINGVSELNEWDIKQYLTTLGLTFEEASSAQIRFYVYKPNGAIEVKEGYYKCEEPWRFVFDEDSEILRITE